MLQEKLDMQRVNKNVQMVILLLDKRKRIPLVVSAVDTAVLYCLEGAY